MVRWHHKLSGLEFEQTLGNEEGQGSLVCCSPWDYKDSNMTQQLNYNNEQLLYNVILISAVLQSESAIRTYILLPLNLPPTPLHPTTLSHHRPLSSIAIESLPTRYLFYTWQCIYANATLPVHPTLPLPSCVHMCILCMCVSLPALKIGQSVPFFQISYIYSNIQYVFLFLTYFTQYDRFQVHLLHYKCPDFIPFYG